MKKHEIRYIKPNIGSLKGSIGKSILETIRNTPRSDRTRLNMIADDVQKAMLAEQKNG
jgi:hypothetical protein